MSKENYATKKQALAAATGVLQFLLDRTEQTLLEASIDSANATKHETFGHSPCRNLNHWRNQQRVTSEFGSYLGFSKYSPEFIQQLHQEAGDKSPYFIRGDCSTCHHLFERPLTFIEQGILHDLMNTPLD